MIGADPPASHHWAAREAIGTHGALHNHGELSVLLQLLDGLKPRLVLEIGTYAGGSAWAWSQLRSVQHIVTVDVDPQPQAADRLAGLTCRTTQIMADSRQPATVMAVNDAFDGWAPDLVVIDGAHDYRAARADWDLYSPLAAPGGLVVLHDTQGYPGNPTVQVPQLWAELRQVNRTTELVDQPGGPGGTGIIWL